MAYNHKEHMRIKMEKVRKEKRSDYNAYHRKYQKEQRRKKILENFRKSFQKLYDQGVKLSDMEGVAKHYGLRIVCEGNELKIEA